MPRSPRRNYAMVVPLLGTMPDATLAAQVHIPTNTIARLRRKQAIAPFRWKTHGPYPYRHTAYCAALRAAPNGLRAADLARALGVSREAVRVMLSRLERRNLVLRQRVSTESLRAHTRWYACIAATVQGERQ